MNRRLLIVAYDVVDPTRLSRALDGVTEWTHGGQRSFFECLASASERDELTRSVGTALDLGHDRLAVIMPPRGSGFAIGCGRIARDENLVYVG